jgi:hypothetical protein
MTSCSKHPISTSWRERRFAEWLSAIDMGLAMGSALLAAQNEGLGTQLLTGKREKVAELVGIPDGATVAQVQLLGYPRRRPRSRRTTSASRLHRTLFRGQMGPAVATKSEGQGRTHRRRTDPGSYTTASPKAGIAGIGSDFRASGLTPCRLQNSSISSQCDATQPRCRI